jgi:hypothetical protein
MHAVSGKIASENARWRREEQTFPRERLGGRCAHSVQRGQCMNMRTGPAVAASPQCGELAITAAEPPIWSAIVLSCKTFAMAASCGAAGRGVERGSAASQC